MTLVLPVLPERLAPKAPLVQSEQPAHKELLVPSAQLVLKVQRVIKEILELKALPVQPEQLALKG